MNQIWLAFLTGLTTGGISCLAVQGGFLASSLPENGKTKGILTFLTTKIIAYTALGAGLGMLGSALVLSPVVLGWMQILAGFFMLATAARMLNIHPIFRYFVIQPPKFALRILRTESKNTGLFASGVLGFLTVLIPCGITQAMMALAVSSASPLTGAGIMFAFTLGTSPIFLTIGVAAIQMLNKKWFAYTAAGFILVLGLISINAGQVLRGSVHTAQNYWKAIFADTTVRAGSNVAKIGPDGKQQVSIRVMSNGYSSNVTVLKVGVPVKILLSTNNTQGCSRAFTIPSYNITKILPATGMETVEFTPTKTGFLSYTCSMGMFTGQFSVVN